MKAYVRLEEVTKEYRKGVEVVRAVEDVTLSLDARVLLGLVGPSGSGKTTLINLIAGWETPTSGQIERSSQVGADWHGLAVVPQGIGLLSELPIGENVTLPLRFGNPEYLSTEALMDELGLSHIAERMPHETSLGEQQRAAVARAAANGPRVLVADEPTAHQDEDNAFRVLDVLRHASETGSAVLVATHDPRILDGMDMVVELDYGRLVDLRD